MNTDDPAARPPGSPTPAGPGHPQPPAGSSSSQISTTSGAPTTTIFGNSITPTEIPEYALRHKDDAQPPSPAQSTTSVPTTNANDPEDIERWKKLFYNSTLGVVIVAPMVALLPPRKLDLFTFALGTAWCMSAGYVCEQKTGKGLMWQIGSRIPSEGNRRRIEEERRQTMAHNAGGYTEAEIDAGRSRGGLAQQVAEREAEERRQAEKERGLLKRVWMGGESDDWVAERARKEQEALDNGKGYGGLIADSVREAFGVNKKTEDEDGN